MAKGKKRMGQLKFAAIWIPVLVVLVAAMLTVTLVMHSYSKIMDFVFGSGEMRTAEAKGTEDWNAEYYTREYKDDAKLLKAAEELTEEIAGEGFVLLKNNGALPLDRSVAKEKAVSCFGWAFSHPVYGGTGSGNVRTETCVTPQNGLENAGFTVNPVLASAYDAWSKDDANRLTKAVNTGNGTSTALMSAFGMGARVEKSVDERPTLEFGYGNWDLIETPVAALDMAQAKEYSDVAVVMISRQGGEQGDLPTVMGDDSFYGREDAVKYGYNPDKHYLELTDEEEALIAGVKAQNFGKIVVVVNSANVMELGELESDDSIDAVIFAPGAGQTGFNALGKILGGDIDPSGKTADIFAADLTKDPTFPNFADPNNYAYSRAAMGNAAFGKRNAYNNITKENSYDTGFFTQYEEGIYVGYRYYETAADVGKDGFVYDDEVVYPFGYGLSYTKFEQEIVASDLGGDTKTVTVKVTNIGDRAGKCAVQLYVTSPYSAGGVEKSTVNLVAFGKTDMLAAKGKDGSSQNVTLTFAQDDLTSYDHKTNKCYVLDEGDYVFSLRTDSHTVAEYGGKKQTVTWHNGAQKIYNAAHDGARKTEKDAQGQRLDEEYVPATNAFDGSLIKDEMDKMTILSRADKFSVMPSEPTDADKVASDALVAAVARYDAAKHTDASDAKPATGAEKTFQLIDMRGLDADDPAWDKLLDQLTLDEMELIITTSGFGTPYVESVAAPKTMCNDGPASLTVSWAGVEGATKADTNAYTCEVALACTWNVGLARRMGEMAGEEALMLRNKLGYPYSGWYAPGANIHRSPFGGRNFEYFSEDALLTGKMAAAEISGATEKGLYVMLKHFVLNDQETYRGGWGYASNNALYTWADEQTIRENYLKAFEIAVKEATCKIKYIADDKGTVSERTIRACTGLMTSFNAIGSTWAGGNKELITDVVRNEWDFKGVIITDFKNAQRAYMEVDQMIRAGADTALATAPEKPEDALKLAGKDTGTTQQAMREACRHMLYATAHSNALNGIKPGMIISYTLAPWQIMLLVCSILIYGFAAFMTVMLILRGINAMQHPENYKRKGAQV